VLLIPSSWGSQLGSYYAPLCPSRLLEPPKRKKVGVCKFSAISRAMAVTPTTTPTPTPDAQAPATPPPSAANSSHSEPSDPVQQNKRAGIKCFNYGRGGHYQSTCNFMLTALSVTKMVILRSCARWHPRCLPFGGMAMQSMEWDSIVWKFNTRSWKLRRTPRSTKL
jgi:hypothetical protein